MFKENKYSRWYFKLITFRQKNIVESDYEIHHIIPKSLGGSDDKDNLVRLHYREHYIAHLLLPMMCVSGHDYYKMMWAMHRVGFVHSNRTYELIRKKWIKFLSENHPSKDGPEWGEKVSITAKKNWKNNTERKKFQSEKMKETIAANKEHFVAHCRVNAKKGGEASRLANATRIEYKGKIYIGWTQLKNETNLTQTLYEKYYLNGIDPEPRIGKNGPPPKRQENH